MTIFDSTIQHIHLTGYKGVAMTSLAQCLRDLGKTLSGSDVNEKFVTQHLLDQLPITTFNGFHGDHIPTDTNLVIFTAAHQGPENPEVIWAREHGIPTLSQAEALAQLFNSKKGIAVCGVGGKSTTSAMISWVFEKTQNPTSFSVGVGNIPGLSKTGQWSPDSEYFVAEADEYVIDPHAKDKHQPIVPRFSFLHPWTIVCTKIAFDHPDVYENFEETQRTFLSFFSQLQEHGHLIINGDQEELVKLSQQLKAKRPDITVHSFGFNTTNSINILQYEYTKEGRLSAVYTKDKEEGKLSLRVPGKHNLMNAIAALLATRLAQITDTDAVQALRSFHSTQRRFEFKGQKDDVLYYDDYAHHPSELKILIETLKEMFPKRDIFIAFQPHTFSRTRALFPQFVEALAQAPHLILTDIFASAREQFDPTMNSLMLIDSIEKNHAHKDIRYIPTLEELAEFSQAKIPAGSVFVTVGAGDIYSIYDKMKLSIS